MSKVYTENEPINMINTLQDEQTQVANAKYNFERFIGKPIKSLDAIKHKVKVDSNLWPGLNRNVRLFEPQFELTQDEMYIKNYDDLSELIQTRPNDIIKNISAYGLFSINISV